MNDAASGLRSGYNKHTFNINILTPPPFNDGNGPVTDA